MIACALEKNASARYANAIEMTRALSPFGKTRSPTDSLEPPVHDTQRDPVVEKTPPMAPRVVIVPVEAQPVHSSAAMPALTVAVMLAALILVGGGVGFAYSQGYVGRTAPAPQTTKTPQAVVTPLPTAGEIATLTPTATETAPVDSALATAPVPTPTVTPTPTFTATAPPASLVPTSTGAQPPECTAARMMKAQGHERQAAQLALRCIRKGGAPPF